MTKAITLPALLVLSCLCSGAVAQEPETIDGQANVEKVLDNPIGQYYVDVNGQSRLKLRGRIRTLRIRELNGQSTIDAGCLVADEVIVERRIDGQLDLIITTSRFTFDEINGQSVVLLKQLRDGPLTGRVIDGQSTILWMGPGTPVTVTGTGAINIGGRSRIRQVTF